MSMLMTQAVGSSQKFAGASHVAELARCDSVSLFLECGWANAMGFVGSTLCLHVHAHTMDDLQTGFKASGYWFNGMRLIEMDAQARDQFRKEQINRYLQGSNRSRYGR
jgi:hypothetical protein